MQWQVQTRCDSSHNATVDRTLDCEVIPEFRGWRRGVPSPEISEPPQYFGVRPKGTDEIERPCIMQSLGTRRIGTPASVRCDSCSLMLLLVMSTRTTASDSFRK